MVVNVILPGEPVRQADAVVGVDLGGGTCVGVDVGAGVTVDPTTTVFVGLVIAVAVTPVAPGVAVACMDEVFAVTDERVSGDAWRSTAKTYQALALLISRIVMAATNKIVLRIRSRLWAGDRDGNPMASVSSGASGGEDGKTPVAAGPISPGCILTGVICGSFAPGCVDSTGGPTGMPVVFVDGVPTGVISETGG